MKDSEKFNMMLMFLAGVVLTWSIMSSPKHIETHEVAMAKIEKVEKESIPEKVVSIKEILNEKPKISEPSVSSKPSEPTKVRRNVLFCVLIPNDNPFRKALVLYIQEERKVGQTSYYSYSSSPYKEPFGSDSSNSSVFQKQNIISCEEADRIEGIK